MIKPILLESKLKDKLDEETMQLLVKGDIETIQSKGIELGISFKQFSEGLSKV